MKKLSKEEKLAAALRDNLKKRKEQARGRETELSPEKKPESACD